MLQLKRCVQMMGTCIEIRIESPNAACLMKTCLSLLRTYEHRFSANDASSELMQIAHQAGKKAVRVQPDLFDVIAIGKYHSLAKNSFLNIALGPVIDLWRIGFSDAKVPSKTAITKALSHCQAKNIHLNPKTSSVFLTEKGMKLDLGAIAKGYIADQIMTYLKGQSLQSAMINMGGNLIVYGNNPQTPDGNWHIGIQHPEQARGKHVAQVTLSNQAVATSGIAERQLKTQLGQYHHLLDPKTGYPLQTDITSLTLVAKTAFLTDIWSTRLFGLRSKDCLDSLTNTQEVKLDGIILTQGKHLLISPRLLHQVRTCY